MEGRFSIMTTVELKEQVNPLDTPAGKVNMHIFMADKEGFSYGVMYTDYPADTARQTTEDKMLDGARDGAVTNVRGTLLSEDRINLDGRPGRKVAIAIKNDAGKSGIIKSHMYVSGNRLYTVMVAGEKSKMNGSAADEFLGSFKLAGQ